MCNRLLSWTRQLTVSAALGRKIENDRSGRHALDHRFGYQDWRFLAWHNRGRYHRVAFRNHFSEQLALLGIEGFILRFRVSACVLCIASFKWQFHKPSAQTLHLLFHSRTNIVRRHHSSHPLRRCNRLQSGDASTNYQNSRRRDCPGGRGHHGKNARQFVRNHHHSFVSGDRSHRGKRVHALSACGARHQLNRICARSRFGHLLHSLGGRQRPHEPDQHLTFAH